MVGSTFVGCSGTHQGACCWPVRGKRRGRVNEALEHCRCNNWTILVTSADSLCGNPSSLGICRNNKVWSRDHIFGLLKFGVAVLTAVVLVHFKFRSTMGKRSG